MLEKEPLNQNEDIRPKKKKRFAKGFRVFVAFLLTVLISANTAIYFYKSYHPAPSQKLQEIDGLIKEYYWGDVDEKELDDALAKAYIKAIDDKYGFYKNTEDAVEITNSFKGNDVGIGVTVYFDDSKKSLNVFRVDSESPAATSGIKRGDKITYIDGTSVLDLGYEKAIKALAKQVGEKVELEILRSETPKKIVIQYKEFTRQSVYYEKINDFGYICFTGFNSSTVKQFENALNTLMGQQIKGLIFDVRDNGGGTVDSTCKILDILVGECDLMTTEYADGVREVNYTSNKDKIDLPMCVLVNKKTASAAELFAATIKNIAKGIIIGNTTYGKGVVQRTYYLIDKSCVRFTVGEFFPAGGKSFNKVGIIPDHEVSFSKEQLSNKYVLGKNDPYIQKAVESLNEVKQ